MINTSSHKKADINTKQVTFHVIYMLIRYYIKCKSKLYFGVHLNKLHVAFELLEIPLPNIEEHLVHISF